MGKTFQINGIPVGLLHRRTVISTHYNTGISCPECLTGESGAFQGNLICINLCENFVMHFEADGPITERICFDGFWLGKAVVFQFFGIHHQRFFLIGDLDAGFFTTGFAAGFFGGAFLPLAFILGGGAVTLSLRGGMARIRHLGPEPIKSSRWALISAS